MLDRPHVTATIGMSRFPAATYEGTAGLPKPDLTPVRRSTCMLLLDLPMLHTRRHVFSSRLDHRDTSANISARRRATWGQS